MKAGDLVKLTARYAAVLNRSPKCKVDWLKRRGIVEAASRTYIYIVWDGVKNRENWPRQVVELAVSEAEG